jgi:endonuclease YncB( thermonuclease family)
LETDAFQEMPDDRFNRRAILINVVDGDTFDVEIDLGWSMKLKERVRLEGLDTPEIRRKEEYKSGIWVKEEVEKLLLPSEPLIITSMAYERTGQVRGKFGRTMAVVYRLRDKLCLNQYLLEKKIAWATDKHGKLLIDRSLLLLTGIPEDRK